MMIFERMRFQFPWRPYQQRVLDKLDAYAINNRIHIVAAPGAGKTVLGLEMVRRLARKAIILSPTRIIRDQWLYRLGDFGIDKDWHTNSELSIVLNEPAHINSITYQALHAYHCKEDTYQNLIKEFEQKKINLIVLDEAHHLRSEWWKALEKLVASIDNLMIISLTATPPYDVKESEWQRYEKLCGPIDEEISVPELVKSGTLCPHQDYIYAVDASMHEQERLSSYYEAVKRLCITLYNCNVFERVILTYSFLQENDLNINAIEKELPAILAVLSFLRDKKLLLPEPLIQMLDLQDEYIPEFDIKQWQTLLDQLFFRKHYFDLDKEQNAYVRQLKSQLRQSGMLVRRELNLTHSRSLSKMLKMSVKKIDACVKINSLERAKRKDKLRQVILTDYIRDEQLTHKKVSQHDSLYPDYMKMRNQAVDKYS